MLKKAYFPDYYNVFSDARYIITTFPLLKKLKPLLLDGRPGMDDCPIFWLIDNNMDTEWGYCVPAEGLVAKRYKWEIGVAGEFPTRRKYLGTLVHELFHLYQMTILGLLVPNHGKRFTAYMNTTAKRELDKMLRKERKSNGT